MSAYRGLLARLDGLRTRGVDLGLERVRRALGLIGSPEAAMPAVQIAGTNGKGSTAAMTESILRAAGLRTGLFTSPHLCRFTERIRIDGREVDGDRLAALDERVRRSDVPLTYFEVATLLAFLLMAEERVDVAVLETGLGGRLDATTTCHALATCITSIALDHTEFLGPTLADIAREKSGIARAGVPLCVGPLPAAALEVVARAARQAGAPLRRLGVDFGFPAAPVALAGPHQISNAALAVALSAEVARRLGRPLSDEAIRRGLASVAWPGRLERIGNLVLDAAHNVEGARALAAALATLPRPRALVTSVLAGKDAGGMLDVWSDAFDHVVVTRSRNPRALATDLLREIAASRFASCQVEMDVPAALAMAQARAGSAGITVVAGSVFVVGEARAHVLGEAIDPIAVSDPL